MRMSIPTTAFTSLLLLSACAIITHRIEIESYSIQVQNLSAIANVVGNDVTFPIVKQASGKTFALVKITTNKDLLAFTNRLGSTIFADTWFCSKPDQKIFLGPGGVYVAGKDVMQWDAEFQLSGKRDKTIDKPIFEYDLVLMQARKSDWGLSEELKSDKNRTSYLKFDLQNSPKDVCISLSGGTMTSVLRSNTIVIPAADLRKIFR